MGALHGVCSRAMVRRSAHPGVTRARSFSLVCAVFLGSGLGVIGPARAGTEVIIDNRSIRVILNNYVPAEASGEHEHEDPRFIFVVQPGTLESTDPSGATTDRSFEADSCLYAPPIRHSVRNIGRTEASLLEVEIKGAPGPTGGPIPCMEPDSEPDVTSNNRPVPGGKALRLRRTVLLKEPDLVVSRIELESGVRERAARGRGDRLVYVLVGGAFQSKTPNGKRVVATQGSAVWIGGAAPLEAQDNGDLVLLEVEPLTAAKP